MPGRALVKIAHILKNCARNLAGRSRQRNPAELVEYENVSRSMLTLETA
jgi:hypothetical protein